jgi:hypothetical protein
MLRQLVDTLLGESAETAEPTEDETAASPASEQTGAESAAPCSPQPLSRGSVSADRIQVS